MQGAGLPLPRLRRPPLKAASLPAFTDTRSAAAPRGRALAICAAAAPEPRKSRSAAAPAPKRQGPPAPPAPAAPTAPQAPQGARLQPATQPDGSAASAPAGKPLDGRPQAARRSSKQGAQAPPPEAAAAAAAAGHGRRSRQPPRSQPAPAASLSSSTPNTGEPLRRPLKRQQQLRRPAELDSVVALAEEEEDEEAVSAAELQAEAAMDARMADALLRAEPDNDNWQPASAARARQPPSAERTAQVAQLQGAVQRLQLPALTLQALLQAAAEGAVGGDMTMVEQKVGRMMQHVQSRVGDSSGDPGSALDAHMQQLAAALDVALPAAVAAAVAVPALAAMTPHMVDARIAQLGALLGSPDAGRTKALAVQTPALLVAPLEPLALKLKVLCNTTGLPAQKACTLITPYMFRPLG